MNNPIVKGIGIAGIVWGFAYGLLAYLPLPERVPVHFGIDGNPDRYGTKLEAGFGILLIPVVFMVIYAVFFWVTKTETRVAQKKILEMTQIGITILMIVVQFSIVQAMQQGQFKDIRLIVLGLGVLFVALGNLMPKIAPNAYVGVRIPWTFASDRAWYASNRLGAWIFVVLGGLLVVAAVFLPNELMIWVIGAMVVILLMSLLWLWFYSKSVYQTDPDRRTL
jgi:uncharacterized membrane protein